MLAGRFDFISLLINWNGGILTSFIHAHVNLILIVGIFGVADQFRLKENN